MIIDISTKIGTTSNQGGFKGLLDVYSGAAAAYSLRKLSKATTSVVRVRRDSDNAEADFTALEITDGTLEAFCTGTDGLVTTWYDQSGNGNDATQGSASAQPKIVSAGVLVTENGEAAVDFDGISHFLFLDSTINNGGTETVIIISNSDSALNGKGILRFNTNTYYRISDIQGEVDYSYGFPQSIFNFLPNANQKLIFATSTLGTKNVYQNGNVSADNPIVDGGFSYSVNRISTTSNPYDGRIQELVIYTSDQSTNRSGIEANINKHYNIYP